MVAAYSQLLQKRFGGQLGPTGDEYIGYTIQGAMRMESLLARPANVHAGVHVGPGAE